MIKIEQKQFYKEEYEALKTRNSLNKDSSFFSYMLYLDDNGILRLRGRLKFSDLLIMSNTQPSCLKILG